MTMRARVSILSRVLAGAACAAAALAAHAQNNLNFLNDTPISYFSKADTASLAKAVQKVRDEGKDGETVDWANDGRGTKLAAKLTPTTNEQEGRACREIRTEIEAKGQSMTLRPLYCKTSTGKWQLQKR
ncbi:RT0821/Lpp0805 family surface protein [Burkholderia thailandensis]|uniref:Surface antigen domain-containing protein n=2 Tax=Burkholderia thailandensis TaxID=57975 RepID=A0AAW9CUY1_BURTH|nr:RT0821/Lpp0805 family surface protein [Burkholderia thailandensis]ABC37223.1 conserved hypothetical protein [Burkholderia thailandensis E264]AHI63611.1 hypothetical protein BTL_2336 [Burkholderia thailandensis H0587]AHI73696.1 hypothetical protein BTQ_1357 [Burkholderia thailandensis 2002721723]AHI78069.1 hypothetical protein BTJ_1095 [Burkholderia thailandensis E444]AIC87653.1 hypothetical protein BTRA_2616 [Burkholderia thailandensis USAMRU Malaysia \